MLGLQEVTTARLQYLTKCLDGYRMITTKKRNRGLSSNPIFVKRNRRFRVMKAGIFQLVTKPNSTQTQSCSWIKLRFAERLKAPGQVKESFRDKMLRLLRQSTNNAKQRNRHIPKRRRFYVQYRWKDIFIANTQLDTNDAGVAEHQIVHVMTKCDAKTCLFCHYYGRLWTRAANRTTSSNQGKKMDKKHDDYVTKGTSCVDED